MKFSGFLFLVIAFFLSYSCSEDKKNEPDNQEESSGESPAWDEFIFGADLSYVNQVEDHGGQYLKDNEEVDPYQFFSDEGSNLARIRLWHNPDWVYDLYEGETPLYSGPADAAKSIERARKAGMAVLLDFHYSDTWADPGHQDVPEAWRDIEDLDVLTDSVYNYTYKILSNLDARGLLPEMVQIGNETNCGMMMTNTLAGFPSLNVCDGNWEAFGSVVNAGIKAVRDVEEESGQEIMVTLHIADPKNLSWWPVDVMNEGNVTDFDVIGFSYYHIWHDEVAFDDLPDVVRQTREETGKEVLVLETAYPFTTANNDNYGNIFSEQTPPLDPFPYSVEGQKDFLITLNQNMMDAGAMGVIYWEPPWISSNMEDLWGTGSSWENCAFFNFSGNASEVLNYLSYEYSQ